MNVILRYNSGSWQSQTFSALALKGLTSAEDIVFRGISHSLLDGSLSTNISGFHRKITVDLGVITSTTSQKFILNFLKSNEAQISSGGYVAYVCPADVSGYADEWLQSIEYGSKFVLELVESTLQSDFQSAYVETETMILFRHVQITGTQASPQPLTSGISPLDLDVGGDAPPTFDDATQKVFVDLNGAPYQEAAINLVTQPSNSGGNITFQVAVSDGGNPASDGLYYCDIALFVQTV